MALKIFGAGMAGLLAAHILRRHEPVIYEAQTELPNNHKALLRFRSSAVSEATGIPFKRVKVLKGIWDWRTSKLLDKAPLDLSNMYSLKVIGTIHGRSVVNLEPSERYIAPDDFIAQLASGLDIKFNRHVDKELLAEMAQGESSVSTIPMPTLMEFLGARNGIEFKSQRIWSYCVNILRPEVDVYQTVYFPEPSNPLYRVSITGNKVTCEFTREPASANHIGTSALLQDVFGISHPHGLDFELPGSLSSQKYGKILPIDDDARRAFILMATDKYRIYSVGRFATWRQILLDDVVKDCKFVDTMLNQRDRYATRFLTATR